MPRLAPDMESPWADVATFAATAPVRISRGEAGEGPPSSPGGKKKTAACQSPMPTPSSWLVCPGRLVTKMECSRTHAKPSG